MNEHDLRVLEFGKIIDGLAERTAFSASHDLALRLRPTDDPGEVRRRLQETTEAKALIAERTDVGVGGAHDVRDLVHRAALGGRLLPADLLDIRYTLESARAMGRLIVRLKDTYPLLAETAWEIQPLTEITDEIVRCLDDDGRVLDSASPTLAHLRRESRIARDRLMDRLHRMVTNADYAAYLQDPIITERNGRLVIPLKVQYRGKIDGIVHDQSSSGATLFIEPLATVELNNQWHELQLAEQREVDRILLALSALVGQEEEAIGTNVVALAHLDLAIAKARYSFDLKATPADLSESRWPAPAKEGQQLPPSQHPLHLINARHPLLPAATVVPITVFMGGDYTTLLVTGPNTGGKTVTLKTIGLLAAMNQAGLHIPATPGSRLPVFSGIYADIGDEQSIEQSLSTFSSHMSRIVEILDQVDDGSLVLLDELGAGTDPVEGAALAQALIDRLLAIGCLAVSSTHYSQLKVYAYSTPGVRNASVEFDIETLSPTYRLLIGLPGRSNAFAIAQRLGLAKEIIAEASQLISPEALAADELLGRVKQASDDAERALRHAEQSRQQAREQEDRLRDRLAEIEEQRRQVLNEARAQGRQELEQVHALVRQFKAGLIAAAPDSRALETIRQTIDELEHKLEPLAPAAPPPPRNPRRLQVGDTVQVHSLGQEGELTSLAGGAAEVRLGSMRLRTERANLSFVARPEPVKATAPSAAGLPLVASPGIEIDLRGMRVDEVIPAVNQYLDSAYLAGLPWVHLIHGKGNGVLKQVVRDLLRDHPLIDTYRPGEISEGGEGITVAKLHQVAA